MTSKKAGEVVAKAEGAEDTIRAFGERLLKTIGDESKRSFARRCGFSDGLLSAYLKGEKAPGMRHLVMIAKAAGVSLDWLATGCDGRAAEVETKLPGLALNGMGLEAVLLPAIERFLDCLGKEREFVIELVAGGSSPVWMLARERRPLDEKGGYCFAASGCNEVEALLRLRRKIQKGISRRYLALAPDASLHMLTDTLVGYVGEGVLVIDGRALSPEILVELLERRRGEHFVFQFPPWED
ncbi:helix-turn-helix domain-containing protein [Azoarcus indigens]|uniref:Helix-turn-helix protein n=1 Tax=Azoarcus indigens TaxID=29545 RepID=A0A4R6DL86_9RHOO|nr:helix-turn-helix transcriptional regulator [Azoarcus indigens]NMG67445.1 helix-turn-helix domain-containing protein [Azoarcus indigens]TDN45540.1 helix-turn-helix protein [Azoarcus indigens]